MNDMAFFTQLGGLIDETIYWFLSLDAGFAFLLALPIIVAFAGFFSDYLRKRRRARSDEAKAAEGHA